MTTEAQRLDPDEPNTPTWFTYLGVALFLLFGIAFLLKSASADEQPEVAAAPSPAPAEIPSAPAPAAE